MNATDKLKQAKLKYRASCEALAKATREAFPVGRCVAVTMGRSRVVGVIRFSGSDGTWQPDRVGITNIVTGKQRHFQASCEGYQAKLVEC